MTFHLTTMKITLTNQIPHGYCTSTASVWVNWRWKTLGAQGQGILRGLKYNGIILVGAPGPLYPRTLSTPVHPLPTPLHRS